MDLSTRMRVSSEMHDIFEWEKWTKEIPYINFPERFEVKIIPPFTGAVIRFLVRDKEYPSASVSVYLDCYEILGIYGSPYWEIYPYIDGDTYRCGINEIDELLQIIVKSIDKLISDDIEKKVKNKGSKFYTYIQNNSHGYFEINDNICEYVIIEAKSAEHANNIAESIGIYFDGCTKGIDCTCCGDRWDKKDNDNDGTSEPMIYKTPINKMNKHIFRDKCIIHYLNGEKETVKFN